MGPGGRRLWKGACHCRRTRFEITADIDHARVCNCSVCRQRGALIFRVPAADFRLLTPIGGLACYIWGSGTARDYFCPACGILPFRKPRALTEAERAGGAADFTGWAVNLRCLEGLDPDRLPKVAIGGASLRLPDQLP